MNNKKESLKSETAATLEAWSLRCCSGPRPAGLGFRVSGLGFRVQGFGFRVSSLGVWVCGKSGVLGGGGGGGGGRSLGFLGLAGGIVFLCKVCGSGTDGMNECSDELQQVPEIPDPVIP